MSYVALRLPPVQTRLVRYFTERIERNTGVSIQIGGVDFRPMRSLVLEDVLLKDLRNDTLLFCKDFRVKIDSFRWADKSFVVREVLFDDAYFNLWIERGEEHAIMNIETFLEALQPSDGKEEEVTEKSGKGWLIGLDRISIRRSRFVYREQEYEPVEYGINWTDVVCHDLNLDVTGLDFSGGKTRMVVSDLSLKEKSGFIIKQLDAQLVATDGNLLITESKILTERSVLNLKKLEYNWTPNQSDWRNFITRMQQWYELSPSSVSFIDLAYFNGSLCGIENTVECSGVVFNTVDKIEGKDLKISFGNSSMLRGRFKSDGLPDFRNTLFDIDFYDAHVSPEDLETIYLPWFDQYIHIPAPLHHLPHFDLSGNFKGTIGDFLVGVQSVTPGLGGDASFMYAPCIENSSTCTQLSGHLNLNRVDCGQLSGITFLGNGDFTGDYSGLLNGDDFTLDIAGKFNTLGIGKGKVKDGTVFLKAVNDKADLIFSVDNDSVKAGVVLNYDTGDRSVFVSGKGNVEVDNLEDFGVSLVGKREGMKLKFDVIYAGDENDNSFSNFEVSDFMYSNETGSFGIQNMNVESSLTGGYYITTLKSDVADISMKGNFNAIRPLEFTQQLLKSYLPAYNINGKKFEDTKIDHIDFQYAIDIKDANRILRVVYPELSVSAGTRIYSYFSRGNESINLTLYADTIKYKDASIIKSKIDLKGNEEYLDLVYAAELIAYQNNYSLYNVRDEMRLKDNRIVNKLMWGNWNRQTYSGSLSADVLFSSDDKHKYKSEIIVHPGVIVMADSVWRVKESRIMTAGKEINIDNFLISRGEQHFSIDGNISENPDESLAVNLNDFNMAELNRILFDNRFNVFGMVSGNVTIKDYYKNNLLYSDIQVIDWGIGRDTLGSLRLKSYWDADSNRIIISAANQVGNDVPLQVAGYYMPETDSIGVSINLSKVGLERIGIYATDYISESRGGLSGVINISGSASHPDFSGFLRFDSVALKMTNLNTRIFINDSIQIDRNKLVFNDLFLRDEGNNPSVISGYYQFGSNKYDLNIKSNNFLLLNTDVSHNDLFYGKVYISAITSIHNRNGIADVSISARTEKNSRLYFPLSATMSEQSGNFLYFINKNQPLKKKNVVQSAQKGFDLTANLELNDGLEIQIVFDPTIGDILKSTGSGNIKVNLDKDGMANMFGEYKVTKGDYLFTMSNLLNKRFVLAPGGTITWNGSPYNATVDLKAVYNLKTSLYELMPEGLGNNTEKSTKVPVECILNLSDNFINPLVKFDINFPTLETQTRSYIQSFFSSQDEINKQMFSLLIMNKFYTPDYLNSEADKFGDQTKVAGLTTVTEMMTSQLSRWFSQISNKLDFGFSYRPGDKITTDEIEVALSTQILNDRVMISANGNVDVGGTRNATGNANSNSNANNIAGDFDVDVKLNKQGTLKLKAYSHTNEKVIYGSTEMVQGVGVSYQESFDTVKELVRKYLNFFRRKKVD